MSPLRKTALVAGVLYLLTFVSIPTLALYGPVRGPGYITGPGPDTGAIAGGILEVIVALACIGTAVVLYPVVKRDSSRARGRANRAEGGSSGGLPACGKAPIPGGVLRSRSLDP